MARDGRNRTGCLTVRTLSDNLALFQVYLYASILMETAQTDSGLWQLVVFSAWLWSIVTIPFTLAAAVFALFLAVLSRYVGYAWSRVVALGLTAGVAAAAILFSGSLEDAPQLVTYGLYGVAVRLPGQPLVSLPVIFSTVGGAGLGAFVGLVRPELF